MSVTRAILALLFADAATCAACELRGDNFKLAVVSSPPAAGAPKRVYVSRLAGSAELDRITHGPARTNTSQGRWISGLSDFQIEKNIGGQYAKR
jgi:hypothetical protein